ncbi:cation transporter [Pontibacter ruber]|uniref:Cation transporter n=1 Tax=Pontibacter ruber TaxID=1343895 RepID=A0ABW5D2T9_9BACT|nr:cation transporter [Pontibacter ruber]
MVQKSTFRITQMDCPSEEQMIRLRLEGAASIQHLDFDIPNRQLTVYHTGEVAPIADSIDTLNLNSTLLGTEETEAPAQVQQPPSERKLLWAVLLINFSLFLIEVVTGIISRSMGLVADSLDMLADAIVYGLSLFAVGGSTGRKKGVAKVSGYFQLALAVLGFAEVIRRFLGYELVPDFQTMIYISLLALAGNATSLYLLQKAKSTEAHIRASWIFTSNDVIANIGVITAGVIVYFTNSNKPDLIIGTLVFLLVARGAFRILKLAR